MFGVQKQDKNVTEKRTQYVGGSDVPVILGQRKSWHWNTRTN